MFRSHLALLVTAVSLTGGYAADPPKADRPTAADFQKRIEDYSSRWTMTDGKLDLSKVDEFYATGDNVIIFDFAPPGVSASWAAHRKGLEKELFAHLKTNSFIPRKDVTLRLVGDKAAVTTFTFDYENEGKDGKKFKLTGRQTNVWEKTDKGWVIVHEHGSPVPQFKDK